MAQRLDRRHPCLHEGEARKSDCIVEPSPLYAAEATALQAGMPAVQSGALASLSKKNLHQLAAFFRPYP